MPISIRLFLFARPTFGLLLKVRIEPPGKEAKVSEPAVRDAVYRRLPPRLVRDILPD